MKVRLLLALGALLAAAEAAQPGLPIRATFTGSQQTYSWRLEDLDPALPADWSEYTHLVLEWRASHSQRFGLGLDTDRGRITRLVGPFAGVWVRASIPLRFYREPPGSAIDLAATYNQPRSSYWINLGNAGGRGPARFRQVHGLSVTMWNPVGRPTIEIRSVSLATSDPGDAVLEGKPLIDQFGQYARLEWPEKAHSLDQLRAAWAEEEAALENAAPQTCPYGGYLNTSAKATGFFRVEQIDGRWWFVCPDGHLFFSTGLNGVGYVSGTRVAGREDLFAQLPPGDLILGAPNRPGPGGSFYTWNLQRRFGSDWVQRWAEFTTARLRAWGFNSIHYWGPRGDPATEPRIPYAQMLRGWQTQGTIMGMPDVYADDFTARVDAAAGQQLDPRRDDPYMLGYFIGNEPPWPGRESELVDAFLAAGPSPMATRLKALLAEGDTPRRREQFVHEAFQRYMDIVNQATRRHAPNHLNLGIRFGGDAHDALVRASRGCDVFSINIYGYAPAPEVLDRFSRLTGHPLLIGEFHIGAPDRGLSSGLVQAMNQDERGKAYRYYVEQSAAHPAMIGTHWFQWLDQPATGRADGENYNIGFVDVTDRPYSDLLAAARETHRRLLEVHGGKAAPYARLPKAAASGASTGGQ